MMNWGDSLFILPWDAGNFAREESGHRITLDTGHMLHAGVRREDWQGILEYVAHVHVRDARQGKGLSQVPYGEGDLDIPALVKSLRETRYSGHITVEYVKSWEEGGDLDPERESLRLREVLEDEMKKSED